MAIISVSNHRRRYGNTQLRYALIYICITLVVLLFLNIYTAGTSQKTFYQNKENSMIEKCLLASSEIASLEVLNPTTASATVAELDSLRFSRLIITDRKSVV